MPLNAFSLKEWIDEHRHLLQPPVGNAQIWRDSEFIVMIVGGPNSRKDFHVDAGEEFFHQLEGDMTLRIVEDGAIRDVNIREGDIFLLPPFVPHSPQRSANTVGMVVERVRNSDEADGFQWYCEQCGHKLHEVFLHVSDITTQLKPVFDAFWADLDARTCSTCGTVMEPPL